MIKKSYSHITTKSINKGELCLFIIYTLDDKNQENFSTNFVCFFLKV